MTCERLSDRMPAVAAGAATWSDAEAEHLRTCADCQAEWAVVSAGAAVAHGASIDADALAARVLQRLRTEPAVRRPRRTGWLVGLAAAAAIALVLWSGTSPDVRPRGPAAPRLTVDVPGLNGLAADELADVLDVLGTPWTETSTTDAPSLDDLDPQELERVERSWEI
jgi:hypothetical protein